MRTVGIVAAVALSFTAFQVHAETKAWTAAKASLPDDVKTVIGVDFGAVQKTPLFAAMAPQLKEKAEIATMLDALKTSCKIEPFTVVQGLVIGLSTNQEDGAVYVSINGIDRAKLADCLKAAAERDKTTKLTIKQTGNITEVTNDKETSYLGWIGKDVVVVSIHATDKPSLLKWMGGKGGLSKSPVGKVLGKVNTSAALWGVSDGDKEIQAGMTAKRVYGAVTYAKGTLDADVHAQFGTAAEATGFADLATKQLAGNGTLPPALEAMFKSIKVTAANDEALVKAKVAEQDLLMLASAMAGAGGGGGPVK